MPPYGHDLVEVYRDVIVERQETAARRIYRNLRDVARRMGLGRMRDSSINAWNALDFWVAVPPRRVKDLDPAETLGPDVVALTFDDGPNPDVTPRLLDLLDEHSAKATFFMCGLAASRHPDLVREVARRGHSIGGHSWDHPHSGVRNLSEDQWRLQVDSTHELLGDLIGSPVTWFRPPRGITDRQMWTALRRQGLSTMMWSIDGWDATLRDPDSIARGVVEKLDAGDVILLHDANANFLDIVDKPARGEIGNQETTIDAVRTILREIRVRGLVPIAIDDLPLAMMPAWGRPRILMTS